MSAAASTIGGRRQEMLTVAVLDPDRREPPAPAAGLAVEPGSAA